MAKSTRSIAEDFVAGDEALAARFAFSWRDWAGAAALRRERPARPWSDDDWEELRRFNRDAGAPPETLAQIERLADPAARVVATGQQAGLALGPLYTLYKALGAIARARRIEKEFGVPTVPCFWVASEDHDFEEARTVVWLSQHGDMESFSYEPRAAVDGLSVGQIPVEDGLNALVQRLEQTTAPTEFRAWLLDWLATAIARSATLEWLFTRLLLSLLGRFGLVALVPRLLGLRRRAAELFEKELERPGWSSRAIIAAGEALARMGYPPALHRDPEDLNFFFYENGRRCKLVWEGDLIALRLSGETVRLAKPGELREAVQADPRRLSCNVAARPMCQDSALSTLGYLGGPGELAYFAQLREVYEGWSVPMPVIAPRPSVVLVDARARRTMEKDGLTLEALLKEKPDALSRKLALANGGGEFLEAASRAETAIRRAMDLLRDQAAPLAPAVDKAIDRLADANAKGLQTVRERMERALPCSPTTARRPSSVWPRRSIRTGPTRRSFGFSPNAV
ncbi:MAG: bacillithiol biosynthesis cysteine-adding enzyme BshC [Candidatus Sumerlaeota bacterium]|nr:bacillithiol biosynthesis cysteine-adding enzyme BshC [Candidatus Sumerlaeota bacterium]